MAKKFPKSDEVHEYTDSESSKNSKQDKFKEDDIYAYHNHTAERQIQNV